MRARGKVGRRQPKRGSVAKGKPLHLTKPTRICLDIGFAGVEADRWSARGQPRSQLGAVRGAGSLGFDGKV